MPVIFDNVATSIQTATVSMSVALTIGANAVLLVFCGGNSAGSVSSVALAGTALTRLGRVGGGVNMSLEVWGLTAPPAGVSTISANYANVGKERQLVAASYINARGSSPFGTLVTGTASVMSVVLSVSASTDSLVVGGFYCDTYVSATNMTTRLNSTDDDGFRLGDLAGAPTVSLSAIQLGSDTTRNWAMAAIPIIFSAVAVNTYFTRALLGVGR